MRPDDIQRAHDALGYRMGWRFMTCPERRKQTARLVLVTLNPSGDKHHGPGWSQEEGSAYFIENWGLHGRGQAPLQQQIQRLIAFLGLAPEDVFSAHFVPFRSPRWASLDRKSEALTFACELWRWLLPQLRREIVVCIGHEPGRQLAKLLGLAALRSLPTGWGRSTLLRGELDGGKTLVALPHLGTFKLFGPDRYAPFLRAAFH